MAYLPCTELISGNRARVRRCQACGSIIDIDRRQAADPDVGPTECLTVAQIARLKFVLWRLAGEIAARHQEPTL